MKNEFTSLMLSETIFSDIDRFGLEVDESKNNNPNELRKVKILGLPSESIAIKLDIDPTPAIIKKFGRKGCVKLSWLIDDRRNRSDQKCDIVIIVPEIVNEEYLIIIGELKTKLRGQRSYRYQLTNSKLYIEYLISLIKEHYGKNYKIKFEFVVFTHSISPIPRLTKYFINQKYADSKIRIRFKTVTGSNPTIDYGDLLNTKSIQIKKFFKE